MLNAVALKEQLGSVSAQLVLQRDALQMAMPKGLTADKLIRTTMIATQNNPYLLECDRRSFFLAVATSAALGLLPDGVLGQGYLVPFKGKVQFIPGYRGLMQLAWNTGMLAGFQAHEVCENDNFSYAYGTKEHLDHVPAEGERGKITHFYSYAIYKDGGSVFEVMTKADVDAIRDRSQAYSQRKSDNTPWITNYVPMGRKTPVRQLAKFLPMSTDRAPLLQAAAAIEDAHEAGKYAFLNPGDEGVVTIDEDGVIIGEEGGGQPTGAAVTNKLNGLAGNSDAITEPPTTQPPRTRAAKATEAPTTQPPGTQAPTTAAPATQPPTTAAAETGDLLGGTGAPTAPAAVSEDEPMFGAE